MIAALLSCYQQKWVYVVDSSFE